MGRAGSHTVIDARSWLSRPPPMVRMMSNWCGALPEQHTAAVLRIRVQLLFRAWPVEPIAIVHRLDGPQTPVTSGLNEIGYRLYVRFDGVRRGDRQRQSFALREGDDLVDVLDPRGHRFFEQHMLTVLQGCGGMLHVESV